MDQGSLVGVGAKWSIWDLHVHTPASIVNGYGGDDDAAWEKFLIDLESLPPDFSVIGINDYWFLDGYKRVLEERAKGRLSNLEAIFPVIEMRVDQFAGSDSHLSRVNLHVIFDPEIPVETIESQFIASLAAGYKLDASHPGWTWNGSVTRAALEDLGASIKQSVPAKERAKFGSDLQEGFNNFNVPLQVVQTALQKSYFQGRTLVGLGKTEWAQMPWNTKSIATKKHVISSADLLFTAFNDTSKWRSAVESLLAASVNHKLLDCSDAHYFSDSDQDMRIGACLTWMNTTPTFSGLKYALEEFDRRVFVGLEPPILSRVKRHPEHFISDVMVSSSNPAKNSVFGYALPLNSGFIAVVGNKGQGKSALLDCIALAGNSSRASEFAFLNPRRFLKPANKSAKEYFAQLTWASGAVRRTQLNDGYDPSAPVSVEYLPQAFVERVCSADPLSEDADEFERELRDVLFTHIPEEERAGEKTFDALLRRKTQSAQEALARLRGELVARIETYVVEAAFRAANSREDITSRIELKQVEVDAAATELASAKARLEELDAASGQDVELETLRHEAGGIGDRKAAALAIFQGAERELAKLNSDVLAVAALLRRAETLEADASAISDELDRLLPLPADRPFVGVSIDRNRYAAWLNSTAVRRTNLQAELAKQAEVVAALDQEAKGVEERLASLDSARERARQTVMQATERLNTLTGQPDLDGSLVGLRMLLERVVQSPERLAEARSQLVEQAGKVHAALTEQLEAVGDLFAPATRFIEGSKVIKDAGLDFRAELRLLPSWRGIAASLDGRRNGDYSDWLLGLPDRVESLAWADLSPAIEEAILRLEAERGEPGGEYRDPASALRSATPLAEFLRELLGLAWLEVRFGLTGDGEPLSQLSPGQRGLILALFYLVVDLRTTPLLLDQPEENLDNATIASRLVPAIHEAAGRRQTIVVTHNANLAIVGDADQIVHCLADGTRLTVSAGSISEIDTARFALDVLEGTKPAFDNRRHKYEAFPDLT